MCSTTSDTDFPRYRDALGGRRPVLVPGQRRASSTTFEGHGELIALNHDNPEVVDYVVDVMCHWLGRGADGWRLDAAYAVPDRVLGAGAAAGPRAVSATPGSSARSSTATTRPGCTTSGFDSVTQYELWKAIWSSLNDGNFHELDWALQRHNEFLDDFVPLTFVGNHDVTRIASKLTNPAPVEHALVVLLTTGGTPSVYAGDEAGLPRRQGGAVRRRRRGAARIRLPARGRRRARRGRSSRPTST